MANHGLGMDGTAGIVPDAWCWKPDGGEANPNIMLAGKC